MRNLRGGVWLRTCVMGVAEESECEAGLRTCAARR